MTLQHDALVTRLLPAVMEAGRLQIALQHGGLSVSNKSDCSPVTEADQRSEAILIGAIHAAIPGVPVVAEEEVAAGRIPTLGERFFLVDPLDGTREYVGMRPEFTVNVALVENGRPVMGIILAPALGEIFATRVDGGAAWARSARLAEPLPPLAEWPRLATRPAPAGGLVAVGSRSHASKAETSAEAPRPPLLAGIAIAERRRVGSSLKFCQIARGDADIYVRLGPTSEWDTAAGQAILEAAGGAVTTLGGEPLRYGGAGNRFLNPHFVAWGRLPTVTR